MSSAAHNGGRDGRFGLPLYRVSEAAGFVGVPPSTFGAWAHGYVRRPRGRPEVRVGPIVTSVPSARGEPSIPFIGLAEGIAVAAFRRAGVSMQHLRRAVDALERQLGLEHALASRRLYTDGAQVFYDFAETYDDRELQGLTIVVSGQRVFGDVVREYLDRVTYDEHGWAALLVSPVTPSVAVDPARGFGQPIFLHGAARVEDVLDRFQAGEPLERVARDFGVPLKDIEDVVRARLPAAA